jgi:hypothetical protein
VQGGIDCGNLPILIDLAARHGSTEIEAACWVVPDLIRFRNTLDIDQEIGVSPSLTNLDDEVRATRQDPCTITLARKQSDGLFDGAGGGVVKCFHAQTIRSKDSRQLHQVAQTFLSVPSFAQAEMPVPPAILIRAWNRISIVA